MDSEIGKLCVKLSQLFAAEANRLSSDQQSDLYKECDQMIRDLSMSRTQDQKREGSENEQNFTKQTGDRTGEASKHCNHGNYYCSIGEYDKAIHHYQIMLNIAMQLGDKAGERRAYGNLGNCYHNLGQYSKAIRHCEMNLKIAITLGDKTGEGRAYTGLGNCFYSLGQYKKAAARYEMHLNIARQTGDKADEGCAYGNLGNCYYSLGQYNKAIQHFELKLNIAKQVGDEIGESHAHGNLGSCYQSLGQYSKAIHHQEMQLKMAKEIGDKAGEGRTYGNLGNCYFSLGQYDKAIDHHEMDLNISKQIGDKAGEGHAQCNLGSCCYSLGQYNEAIQHYKIQLNIANQIGNKAGEGNSNGNLGSCYHSLGQYDEAIRHYELQLKIAKQIGDKAGEGRAYSGFGNCYLGLGQHDKAIHNHELDLSITKQTGDKAGEGRAYRNLGSCYHSIAQYEKAEDILRESLRCYENLFQNVPKQDQSKISIRDTFIKVYKLLISSLLYQDKTEQALVVAERSRARALADLMFTSYSAQCAEVAESKVLCLSDIHEVVRSIGCTVLFLSFEIRGEICMWVIQPNGDVKFIKSMTKRCDPGAVQKDLKLLIDRAREMHVINVATHCEDRSLSAFLYTKEENKQTKEKIGSYTRSDDVEVPDQSMSSVGHLSSSPSAQREETKGRMPHASQETTRNIEVIEDESNVPENSPGNNARKKLYEHVLAPVHQFVEGSQLGPNSTWSHLHP